MKKILLGLAVFSLFISGERSLALVADIDPNGTQNTCVDLQSNLTIANQGQAVYSLQYFLQANGYFGLEPTGYFGLKTKDAVIAYQKAKGILGTGYVGMYTRAQIKSDSCGDNATTNNITPLPPSTGAAINNSSSNAPVLVNIQSAAAGDNELYVGERSEIRGKNLVSTGKDAEVFVGGKEAKVTRYSSTLLYFTTPDLPAGKTYVQVRTSDGVSNFLNAIIIRPSKAPVLINVQSAAFGDNELYVGQRSEIRGSNLVADGKDARVFVGGIEATVTKYSSTLLYFTTPNVPGGNTTVRVETSEGSSNVVNAVIIKNTPSISSIQGIASDVGQVFAGEKAVITGRNLLSSGKDARVYFGDEEAKIIQYSDSSLTIIVPDLIRYTYEVIVKTDAGVSESKKVLLDRGIN